MAVAHDASSESHTGTTGSTSEASFSWTHTPVGTPKGVVVFTMCTGGTELVSAVTYGGVSMSAVSGGSAVDTSTEQGTTKAWFLGASIPTGPQSVVVTRTNNASTVYGVAATVTAATSATELKGTPVLLQEDGTVTEQSVDSGADVAQRYMGGHWGGADPLSAGANSTLMDGIDFGPRVIQTARETTPGSGSRSVGLDSAAASDDRALVHLAVGEVAEAGGQPTMRRWGGVPGMVGAGRIGRSW